MKSMSEDVSAFLRFDVYLPFRGKVPFTAIFC